MSDAHPPDRAGGAVEIGIVNNKVQFSSRDALTGRLDFCIHFERADARAIGQGLLDTADEIQQRPDEAQQRLARAYRLGQENARAYLRVYRTTMEADAGAESNDTLKRQLQLFAGLLRKMEEHLAERITSSPVAIVAGAERPTPN